MLPQRKSNSRLFWERIREKLEKNPNELVLVNTYNHPTLAYRARRAILSGMNPVFSELGMWKAVVIRDEKSGFIAPISKRWTYKHELYMVYLPGENK